MPDNPQQRPDAGSGPFFLLSDHRLVVLSGRDAHAFAQAQFMNDVDALADGQWQWNGWLTPKGRVVALFALLRLDAETIWLLLADADPALFAAALNRFVFRSKITIEVPEYKHIHAQESEPDLARGKAIARLEDGSVELDLGTAAGPRRIHVGGPAAHEDARLRARWRHFDLCHGLPRLDIDQIEQWTPQHLSLERLRAFSVKKGCYPGQEIVARTHFLGKAKRGLMRIEADAPLASGQTLQSGDATVGPLVSAACDGVRWSALIVAPLEHASDSLHVDGTEVRAVPLLDGLAR